MGKGGGARIAYGNPRLFAEALAVQLDLTGATVWASASGSPAATKARVTNAPSCAAGTRASSAVISLVLL